MEYMNMLKGAIDMHMHTAPDVISRKLTDLEAAQDAVNAGMQAIMLKNHVSPTYARATITQEAVPGVDVFGGIVLNAAVGGINPAAVEAACKMNARSVWMPTSSSEPHLKHFKQDVSKKVLAFDQNNKPVPGLIDVLDLIARADIMLATSHLCAEDSIRLVDLAKERGVKKIVVTHPEFEVVVLSIEVQKILLKKGVFFERCYAACNSDQQFPIEELAAQIKEIGWETTVIASDFGQVENLRPVPGLAKFLKELNKCGIPDKHLEACIKDHPKALLY